MTFLNDLLTNTFSINKPKVTTPVSPYIAPGSNMSSVPKTQTSTSSSLAIPKISMTSPYSIPAYSSGTKTSTPFMIAPKTSTPAPQSTAPKYSLSLPTPPTPSPVKKPVTPVAPITSDGQTINPATGGISNVTPVPQQPQPPAPITTPPPVSKPAVPSVYDTLVSEYEKNLQMTPEEIANQKEMNLLQESFNKGYIGEGDRAIPMAFITGRQSSLEKRALDLAKPLEAQAALLQAKRTAALDASKFKLEAETKKMEQIKEASKPIVIGQGSTLFDPSTGKPIYTAPTGLSDGNKLLTLTEAQALGVPYGTTQAQAYGQTPVKPLTEAQGKDLTYGTRADEANTTIDALENAVASYNPILWSAAKMTENTTLGNTIVPDDIKQIRQAERNFITAILRRESGAVISPSEFEVAEKQYFPRPGDDAQTLTQKRQLRNTAIQSFKQSYGGNNTTSSGSEWTWD